MPAAASDRAIIARAIAAAREHWFGSDIEIFDFLQDALTLDLIGPGHQGYSKARVRRFALKVQQFTGPMMAKSLEDTAFYRHFDLLALNEVGGDPTVPALSPTQFHDKMLARGDAYPHGLTATATHDTKRGEDARARLLALSELPTTWAENIEQWKLLNERHAIRSGTLYATVLQDAAEQGEKAVAAAVDHLNGKAVPKEVLTPLPLVTKENVDRLRPSY